MAQAQSEGLLVRFVEKANIGRRKKEQQDYHGHLFLPPDEARGRPAIYLFAVADGVSMGMAGALASQTAVELLIGRFEQLMQTQTSDPVAALQQAYKAAADEIAALSEDRPGMATTCAATLLIGDRLVTTHVGDSRIYLARHQPSPQVFLMGIDHSWVEEAGRSLVRNGELTEQDLLTDRRRHTITRALGMEGEVLIDYNTTELLPGDLILLCSDGLWDLLDPAQLEEFLLNAAADLVQLRGNPAQERLKKLAAGLEEAAMRAGGRDNITLNVVLVEQIGLPCPLPALSQLLAQTAQNVEERTSIVADEVEENPTIQETVSLPTFRPYQPLTGSAKPTQSAAPLNPDAVFSKAQKLFALGHWDEAIGEFLQLEKREPDYHNLYEVLSNTLLRYIEGAITQGQSERVLNLFNRLSHNEVTRYNEMLFDFCLEESRKASQERNYPQTKIFADFAAQLRPSDGRARNLQELSELYLMMGRAGEVALPDRLALAQKIYARDPDFGAIQDDLAAIYMQLGDEAARDGEENDALSWYQMIRPLRPSDTRLISLATNKQRALEDTLVRRENSQPRRPEMISQPLVERPVPSITNRVTSDYPQSPPTLPHDIERSGEGRPDNEAINRLRERVSRAQKAWDAGRKEVGAEYIYLVDQFSALISPNPWQPTFPRVCYDYGKWLLDQRQYDEARPYFYKAYSLGMAAAQQRMNEIDRILREQASGGRGPSPLDLPDSPTSARSWEKTWKLGGAEAAPGFQPLYPDTDAGRQASGGSRQPLIQRKADIPPDATFVGTSHAGDGVLGPERPEEAERPPNPMAAASMAAGNNSATEQENPIATSRERFEKPERLVGASGTMRRRDTNPSPGSPLQSAATREVGRLQSQGLPQPNARPELMRERRMQGFLNLLAGLAPALILGLVLAVIVIIAINLLGNLGKGSSQPDNNSQVATATIAAVTPATTATSNPTVAPTPVVTGPNSVTARLEGIAPAEVRVFLATPNDTPVAYRERELAVDGSSFRLPQALVEKLDPKIKYTLVVRPKDNAARKFVADLPLDVPLQTLWTKPDLSFDNRYNLDISLKIAPEAVYFYPLDQGDQDLDLPGGGRYFKATRHTVRTDFLNFYNRNGGLVRFGFPIGEEFDWKDVGRVQFFERGWLVRSGEGELAVRVGKLGQTVLNDSSFDSNLKPPASVGQATYKVDAAFTVANQNNLYGQPLSAAFEVSSGNTKKRVQYFELARLETDSAVKNGPVFLGLLGTEYARSKNWLR